MIVACPACHAELTLDVLFPLEEQRVVVGQLLERSMGLGGTAMRYVALFRPEKRRMSVDRMCRLVAELLPDITRQAINRKGRDWPAPPELWRQGMETVLAKRDRGTLVLPLSGHGLLYEVMCSLAERSEAAVEAERENQRRNFRPSGPAATPRNLAGMLDAVVGETSIAPTTAMPMPAPQQEKAPEVLARMQEVRQRLLLRGGAAPAEQGTPTTGDQA